MTCKIWLRYRRERVNYLFVPLRYLQFLKIVRFTAAAAAENEPCKVCPLSAYRSPRSTSRRRTGRPHCFWLWRRRERARKTPSVRSSALRRTSTRQLTAPTRPTGCPNPPEAADGRWSVSCGVEARRGAHSCFPALHPRGVGVGGGQRPTNCSQRQEACPRVRAGGWYRFHQLVGSLEHSALRAQIGVRTGAAPTRGTAQNGRRRAN